MPLRPKKALHALLMLVRTDSFAERLLCHFTPRHLADFWVIVEMSPSEIFLASVEFWTISSLDIFNFKPASLVKELSSAD